MKIEMTAYFDNSATTAVCRRAADAALNAMTSVFGNPSSLHSVGYEAERIVSDARQRIASALGCDAEELVFTSGGTEANNLAILSAARLNSRRGRHILSTAAEHPSVLAVLDALEKEGFEVTLLRPDRENGVTPAQIEENLRPETVLVSMMLVNNEIGMRFPVEHIRRIISKVGSPALLHCDAVQTFGHLPLSVRRLGADLVSISGHKLHAPKGIGALYVKKGVRISPMILGGGQERGLRSGTENVPGIAAFGAAVEEATDCLDSSRARIASLRRTLLEALSSLPGACVNSPADGADHILNFSVEGLRSETVMHFLAGAGVCVSAGAACASRKGGSHVLRAMGLKDSLIESALRVSFSRFNTDDELDRLISALRTAVKTLTRAR